MLCNLYCLKARLRLLCNELSTASSLNLISRQLKLRNILFPEQRIPTGYIPPGNPQENFFERVNPDHLGSFCLIPYPRAKYDGRISGGGAKFSQTRRNCSLSLQKILKKLRKVRDSTNFLFGEINKTFIF